MPHGGDAGGLLRAFDGSTLILCDPVGNIGSDSLSGLYHHDTRYLSTWRLELDHKSPVLLTAHPLDHQSQLFYLMNAETDSLPAQGLTIRRHRLVGTGIVEAIEVVSHLENPIRVELTLVVDADFSSVMEVQRGYVEPTGSWDTEYEAGSSFLRFVYLHERFRAVSEVRSSQPADIEVDGKRRSSTSLLGQAPSRQARFTYIVGLSPHERWQTELSVTIEREQERLEPVAQRLVGRSDRPEPRQSQIWADWPAVAATCDRSLSDLSALQFEATVDGQKWSVPAAGLPWYLAIFGRDMLWTAYQALPFLPQLAEGALQVLAELQATTNDPDRDAEPGKILHELRFGKLTALGKRPYNPYYGTVDATSLFLIVLSEHWRVTGDPSLCRSLRPQALAALDWLDKYADRDGDGFVEYRQRAPGGARNHCWKDSEDSIRFANGRLAEGAIAVCEAQGYAYDARLRVAEIAVDVWDDPALAQRLVKDACQLLETFNDRFWIERRGGYYALALDGEKEPVDSLTSNLGHLLWSGIVPAERAEAVVERLTSPALRSGWGLRTMSTEDQAYNPISYHNGSVWPHDNAIAAAGLARYGFRHQAGELAVAIFEAAERFEEHRLPEVYSGHDRSEAVFPVWYPKAACPQGWAAAAPLFLVRTVLGLDFAGGRVASDPVVPEMMTGLDVRSLGPNLVKEGGTRHEREVRPA